MKPSDRLFSLIKSLTKSEKRYFKSFSSLYGSGKGSNYYRLFEAINRQKEYDEDEIKRKLKNEKFIKHLNVTKDYLYRMILKSLRMFKYNAEVDIKLKDMIIDIDVLIKKKLHAHAMKMLKKCKSLAYKYEKHIQIIELLGYEKMLVRELNVKDQLGALEKISSEENMILDEIKNVRKLLNLYRSLSSIIISKGMPVRNGVDINKMCRVIGNPVLRSDENIFSYRSKTLFYHSHIAYNMARSCYPEAYSYSRKLIKTIKDHPVMNSTEPRNYYSAVHNFINVCINMRAYDEAFKSLFELKRLIGTSKKLSEFDRDQFTINLLNTELQLNNLTGEITDNLQIIKEGEQFLKNRKFTDKVYLMLLYFNLSISYFVLGDFDRSLERMNNILNEDFSGIRADIYNLSRLINLLIHYELGNFEHLEYAVPSAYRYFNKTGSESAFEKKIVQMIGRLNNVSSQGEIRNITEDALSGLKKFMGMPQEANMLMHFDFTTWLESKRDDTSFAEALRKKEKVE